MVHAFSSIFLITLYSVVSAARYQLPAGRNYETQDSSSFQHCSSTEGYVSYIQVENAAVNLTGMDMHGSYFTLTWKPIDHNKSWDDSSVISFIITYSQNNDRNKQTIVTLSNYNLNAYIVEDVKPEHIYIISMSVSHYNGPTLTSNTVILCTGTAAVGNSKWFILCVVMLLWLLAILHFLRTWRKKMTLRPTYDISSTSDPRSPYDVPCHSHSYNYLHRPTQRSNSYTPELSRQSSGSTLHCPSKSYKSRSFNDLHTIIPEDMPAGRSDIPSSSGHSYCRT